VPSRGNLPSFAGQLGHRSAAGGQITVLVFRHERELDVFPSIVAGIFAGDGATNKQRIALRIVAPDLAREPVQQAVIADLVGKCMAAP